VVGGLVSSSNPESYAGGSFATSRVSQAGQVKRVGTRRREILRRRELRLKNSSDAGSSVISNGFKRRANDASNGSRSYCNRSDQSGFNGCCTAMWKQMEKLSH